MCWVVLPHKRVFNVVLLMKDMDSIRYDEQSETIHNLIASNSARNFLRALQAIQFDCIILSYKAHKMLQFLSKAVKWIFG